MTALTMPARPGQEDDASPRPVPWRRMAWVTWRQHRLALAGVAALLGTLAVYLWLTGLQVRHAYAAATACHPAISFACQNAVIDFTSAYASPAQTIAVLLQTVPVLIGAFVGAPVLARELETGTFRYAWTLAFGRWRWTLAKLVPLAVTVAAAAGMFSLLFSWYYQPFFADGRRSRSLPSCSTCAGSRSPPGRWPPSRSAPWRACSSAASFPRSSPPSPPMPDSPRGAALRHPARIHAVDMYQPGGHFWPFQWIEGGWLLALSVLLIAVTIWLVRRRAA